MPDQFCPQCGSQVSADDQFCPACGASLDGAAPRRSQPYSKRPPSKQPISPFVLGIIVVAGVLMLAAGLFFSQDDPAVAVTPTVAEAIPFANIPRIELQEAQDRVQAGEALFVDVRGADDYAESHIAGALSIPLGPSELDAAYQDLPVSAEIITYCT